MKINIPKVMFLRYLLSICAVIMDIKVILMFGEIGKKDYNMKNNSKTISS